MKALALVVLVSVAAQAQDAGVPLDAPVLLKAGEPMPFAGVALSEGQAVAQAKRVASAEAERDALRASVSSQVPWWVLPVVAVLAGAAGAGVVLAVKK